MADAVAGGQAIPHQTVSARDWMMRISAQSMVGIEEEDGTPFIGSIKQRASEVGLEHYLMEREAYREKDGDFDPKWEGANIDLAPKLLKRNGGYEDRVTMSKLALDKRWDISKHNKAHCAICEETFDTQRHPMMGCCGHVVSAAREAWREAMETRIKKEPEHLRIEMQEFKAKIFREKDGELAALGTFTPRWVATLNRKREFNTNEMRAMRRFLTTVAQGARGVMRAYTRSCQDKLGNKDRGKVNRAVERIAELRQIGITTFLDAGTPQLELVKKGKKKELKSLAPKTGCRPPAMLRLEIASTTVGFLRWEVG